MVSPTIHFNGNCMEAITFYEKAFKGTNKQVEPPHSCSGFLGARL